MPVQAFIDDSQADGEVLVFAGYLASYEQWEKFSIEWQHLLDGPPLWERVKMTDIAASKDAQRWERGAAFYRVVETYAAAFVAVAVDIPAFERAVVDAGFGPSKTFTPYVFAHRALMDATIQYQHELGISEPIDFIFDAFSRKALIEDGWQIFKATVRPEFRDRIGRDPRFESDDEFLPLQAADMLAWHAREHWLKHRSMVEGGNLILSWKPKRNPPGYRFDFGASNLPAILEEMKGRTAALIAQWPVRYSYDLPEADDPPPEPKEDGDREG